ncbi:VCBS repeat protein [Streptomyces sp. Amel2xB2]|uniref:FG-GAP repeat domain-containing protein n=1 Tax=Streptomyces sp. Amel2xB2 TaxID=1305829 RepID=UPI000DC0210E|nr:VCBS repeat-containing protein [Streptomyces sp. Amel2xB2]RAJ71566.1 VCBS repeat protein [Streptomyces sp. Amel2xB2]
MTTNSPPPQGRSRRLHLAVVTVAAATGLAVTAFGLGWDGSSSEANATPTARTSAGKAAQADADLNGDGFADVVFTSAEDGGPDPSGRFLAVVYGTKNGPDPDKRAVFTDKDLGVPADEELDAPYADQPAVADLDDDGNPDILFGASGRVLWGTPDGPQPGKQGKVELPDAGKEYASSAQPVTGDFDGDGHVDLATYDIADDGQSNAIAVLNGPFKRDGSPAATAVRDNPMGDEAFLTSGDANGDKAADLVVHAVGDDEDADSTLLTGGAGTDTGLSEKDTRLPEGNQVVFGDFDGDGRRDIAVGNSGIANDEDPDGKKVKGWVDVLYGKDPGKPEKIEGGAPGEGFGVRLATADADGDGVDDLAVQLSAFIPPTSKIQVLHGSSKGLGSKPWRSTKRTTSDKHYAPELLGAGNYDADGNSEIVLVKSPYLDPKSHWWFTEGTDENDAAFTTTDFS